MTLEKLASYEHPYYCHDSNYYSNDASERYENFDNFFSEYKDADIDMNLCIRWDIIDLESNGKYVMKIYIMGQRKGRFVPIYIEQVVESDVRNILTYLKPHLKRLRHMWQPLSLI